MRILLDASVIIYLVEVVEPFATLAKPHLKRPDTIQICSDLARLECRVKRSTAKLTFRRAQDDISCALATLSSSDFCGTAVKPLRDGHQNILLAYDNYFTRVVSEIVPISHMVVDRATALRAQYGFKTPMRCIWPPPSKAAVMCF